MPEGDTIHRAAAVLDRALAGRTVLRFESVLSRLIRADADHTICGRIIERAEARGKHLLIRFSGDLVLRTHMRMHGAWHLYRPGERWQRPRDDMRIVLGTDAFEAVAFNVSVAQIDTAREIERRLAALGPDVLADGFDVQEAAARLAARPDTAVADALLDQGVLAGVGNVYKSEALFAAGINPFTRVAELALVDLVRLVTIVSRMMHANAPSSDGTLRARAGRTTTGRLNPSARLWVYGRTGQPCRRCGRPIQRRAQGPEARATYWCEQCQAER
jgi:endonuclease-8